MLLEDENKVLDEEVKDEETEEVSAEEEQELEAGIVAGLTDVDTVPLVKESFLDYAMSVIVARAINHSRNVLVSSVTLWVNITLMVTPLSMVL